MNLLGYRKHATSYKHATTIFSQIVGVFGDDGVGSCMQKNTVTRQNGSKTCDDVFMGFCLSVPAVTDVLIYLDLRQQRSDSGVMNKGHEQRFGTVGAGFWYKKVPGRKQLTNKCGISN